MITNKKFISIKTLRLLILSLLICNNEAGHYPTHSLFGKSFDKSKKPLNEKGFLSNYVSNHPYLSRISNIKLGGVPTQIKSHISHIAIGMTFSSWMLNTIRPNKVKTPKYQVNVTKPSNIKSETPNIKSETPNIKSETPNIKSDELKNQSKEKNNVIFTMEKGGEISGLTNYKLNLDSNTITNVFVQLQIQGIDKELEIGVCNSTYVAQDVDEINIEQGEIITITSKAGLWWWNGVNSNGESGMFPARNILPINKKTIK
tara:strand:+ start:516 stop:1292 length:777 start_codon:yes stop_codon:yes gene_type:complete